LSKEAEEEEESIQEIGKMIEQVNEEEVNAEEVKEEEANVE